MLDRPEAIISIRPLFAQAILDGKKTVELRRRIPPLEVGTRLWIYATLPTAAIVASATVGAILRDSPEVVWKKVSKQTALKRCQFDEYFEGSSIAIGITLRSIKSFTQIDLDRLRKWRSGFHPPQVISAITPAEAKRLQNLTGKIGQTKNAKT